MERANELFNWLTGRTPKKSSKKEGFSKKLKENEKVTKKTMTTMKTTKSITIMGTNGKEKTAEPVQQAPPMNPFQAKTSPQLAFAPPPGATPVRVNVYEQKALKEKLHSFGITGIGIFHSGLEVHGMEWCYGGHPSDSSGIYKMAKPRDLKSLSENFNSQFEYRQTLRLGYTEKTLEQVISLLQRLAERWKGNQYHLFNKNCNHFADAFSLTLCGRGLPAWINRGANTIGSIPFINKIIPQEYLSPRIPKKTKVIGAKGKNGKSKEAAKGKEAPKSVTKGKVESAKTAFKNVTSNSISTSKCSLSGSKMKSEDVAQIKESIKEFLKTEAKETNLETDEEGSEENEEEEQLEANNA